MSAMSLCAMTTTALDLRLAVPGARGATFSIFAQLAPQAKQTFTYSQLAGN